MVSVGRTQTWTAPSDGYLFIEHLSKCKINGFDFTGDIGSSEGSYVVGVLPIAGGTEILLDRTGTVGGRTIELRAFFYPTA